MGQGKFAAAAPLVVGLALAMLALWATSPVVQPLPGRDSSVYLSVGRDMLEGARLYTEVWDHKGPLVHHLNALGWAVGGGVWGVWGVRAFLLTLVVLLAWAVLRAVFSPLAATVGMVMALAPLPVLLEGGNMVEEYGLVGSWAALALVVQAGRTGNIAAPGVAAAGLLVGGNFLLRPNLVASPGVATGWLILKNLRPMPMVPPAALGTLALILGVGALLAAQGSLPAAVAAVWSYNLAYAQLREPFHLCHGYVSPSRAAPSSPGQRWPGVPCC